MSITILTDQEIQKRIDRPDIDTIITLVAMTHGLNLPALCKAFLGASDAEHAHAHDFALSHSIGRSHSHAHDYAHDYAYTYAYIYAYDHHPPIGSTADAIAKFFNDDLSYKPEYVKHVAVLIAEYSGMKELSNP